jgi:hypothetical protein
VVPFYNYLQAAIVLAEDGHIGADSVLRVASELVQQHRFDADALARSYLELVRRGHVSRDLVDELARGLDDLEGRLPTRAELARMLEQLRQAPAADPSPAPPAPELDYVALAERHRGGRNRRARGH